MPKNIVKGDAIEVKDSPMPSTLGKQRIRKAVIAASRAPLAAELAEATGTSRRTASQFLESLSEIAYREVKKNGEITIPGLGKLVKQQRKTRIGRNPTTGETIRIPAKTVVKFRIAKAARDSVLGGTSASRKKYSKRVS